MKYSFPVVLLFVLTLLFPSQGRADSCKKLDVTPARGLLCIHCMHEKATGSLAASIRILRESCLKNVALAFVVDGTFGFDATAIEEAVQELSDAGRRVHLHLYVVNGPAQRRWNSGTFQAFSVMDPVKFRNLILTDATLQDQYVSRVEELLNPIALTKELGGTVTIAPALEDNLDNAAYAELLTLTRRAIPKSLGVKYVRSACSDCAIGNEAITPKRVLREVHTSKPFFRMKGGIVSNDGEFVRFPWDKNPREKPTPLLTILRPVIARASAMKAVFLLWIPKYQGSTSIEHPITPEGRKYVLPSNAERKEIVRLLRTGVETSDS